MLGQKRSDEFDVIERRYQHFIPYRLGNTGGIGNRKREIGQLGRRQAHLGFGGHAVIAAFEFEDLVATGIGAGQADGIHVCLATGGDIAHLFGAGDGATDFLGQFHAGGVVGKESHALVDLLVHRIQHFLVTMANQHRAGTDQVIDIFTAILIPDARTLAVANDNAGVEVAKPSARQNGVGSFDPVALSAHVIPFREFRAAATAFRLIIFSHRFTQQVHFWYSPQPDRKQGSLCGRVT